MKSDYIKHFVHTSPAYKVLRKLSGYLALLGFSVFSILSGKKIIAISTPFGDLGNRLFLFSNIIAFARENNAIVLNTAFLAHRKLFKGSSTGFIPTWPALSLPRKQSHLIERIAQELVWSVEAIASSKHSLPQWQSLRINNSPEMTFEMINLDDASFRRWFESKHVLIVSGYQYVATSAIKKNQDIIRNYFKMITDIKDPIASRFEQFASKVDILIGVMIRHGDYRSFLAGKYFFPTEEYILWIKQAQTLFSGLKSGFIITGNDGLAPAGIDEIEHLFIPHDKPSSREILARCNYIISPPSSYAGWSAFYGNAKLLLLTARGQRIDISEFHSIRNHQDLRDETMPANIDNTISLINRLPH